MAIVISKGSTKMQKLMELLEQAKQEFPDQAVPTRIMAEVDKTTDNVVTSVGKGDISVPESPGEDRIKEEVLNSKTQQKQQELIQSLAIMQQQDVITKADYHNKVKLVQQNTNKIKEAVTQGADALIEMEASLGIVAEPVRERKNQKEFMKLLKTSDPREKDLSRSLIRKLNDDKRQREEAKQEQLKIKTKQMEEEAAEYEREKNEKTRQMRDDKRHKHLEIEAKIRNRREEMNKINEKTQAQVKAVLKEKPKYVKMEEKFKQEVETPALDLRKRELEKVRSLSKPVDRQVLLEHELKYRAQQREQEANIKKYRDNDFKQRKEHIQNMKWQPSLKPDGDKIITKLKAQQENIEREEAKKQQSEKVGNYAKYVKEMYWPKASVRKALELEAIKSTLRHQPIRNSEADSTEKKPKPGVYRDWRGSVASEQLKDQSIPTNKIVNVNNSNAYSSPGPSKQQSDRGSVSTGRQRTNRLSSKKGSLNQNYSSENTHTTTDYLAEMRKLREAEDAAGVVRKTKVDKRTINQLMNDKNLSDIEKIEAVQRKAQFLERQAIQKEKLIQVARAGAAGDGAAGDEDLKDALAVNDMYINAIQAKLQILDQI